MKNNAEYSDEALLKRLRQEDYGAYVMIYDRYWMALYLFARKMLAEEEAEDIVQDVFLMLWTKATSIKIDHLSAFLYIATKHRILKHMQKSKVREKYLLSLSQYAERIDKLPDQEVLHKELVDKIQREVASLPTKMREVFVLRMEDQLSYRDIATKMDIAENTVRRQLQNARKILRVKLEKLWSRFL